MTARTLTLALVACLPLVSIAGCRDEGLVGEGSACAEGCPTHERCANGACVPVNDGVAGDDSDRSDEGVRDHDDHDGPGGDLPGGDGPGDGFPDEPFPEP
jgi:hypothetical protein